MKQTFTLLACLLMSNILSAQIDANELLLHLRNRYYVILRSDTAFVQKTKQPYLYTLTRNTNNGFVGAKYKLIQENNAWFLARKRKKKEHKMRLDTAKNVIEAYHKLNEAYYVAQHLKMRSDIDKAYPLNYQYYHEPYQAWKDLSYKTMHHLKFRSLIDNDINQTKHKIVQRLETYEGIKEFITKNAKTASYETLRDTLSKLSIAEGNQQDNEKWRYYLKAVHEIAEQKPEFFFKLAEDLPDNQDDIFFSVRFQERKILAKLKSATGQESIKKKFFKEKRSEKIANIKEVSLGIISSILEGIGRGAVMGAFRCR